jgi:very-short-patch-repair endonuclease
MSRKAGFKQLEETKHKIGEANRGKAKTEKHRLKLSKAAKKAWELNPNQGNRGKIRSEEHCKAISEAHKGRPTWNKGISGYTTLWKGRHHSNDTKELMKLHHYSRTHPQEFKQMNDKIRPRNPTIYEERVAEMLTKNNIEFVRQYKIRQYCCDFYIPSLNLIVEIDGYEKSNARKQTITNDGYNLLHVWNKDIDQIMKFITGEKIDVTSTN